MWSLQRASALATGSVDRLLLIPRFYLRPSNIVAEVYLKTAADSETARVAQSQNKSSSVLPGVKSNLPFVWGSSEAPELRLAVSPSRVTIELFSHMES